jgi:hypothetical protein
VYYFIYYLSFFASDYRCLDASSLDNLQYFEEQDFEQLVEQGKWPLEHFMPTYKNNLSLSCWWLLYAEIFWEELDSG